MKMHQMVFFFFFYKDNWGVHIWKQVIHFIWMQNTHEIFKVIPCATEALYSQQSELKLFLTCVCNNMQHSYVPSEAAWNKSRDLFHAALLDSSSHWNSENSWSTSSQWVVDATRRSAAGSHAEFWGINSHRCVTHTSAQANWNGIKQRELFIQWHTCSELHFFFKSYSVSSWEQYLCAMEPCCRYWKWMDKLFN